MNCDILADGCSDVGIYVPGSMQHAVYLTSERSVMHIGLQKTRRYPSLAYHKLRFIRGTSYIRTESVQSSMGEFPNTLPRANRS